MNTNLRIVIGSDHKGVELKEAAVDFLKSRGFSVEDIGTDTKAPCNYAEFANTACKRVVDGRADRAILICFTGLGMSIAANRWKGIRATLCRTAPVAALARNHNNSNVLCLAAAFVTPESLDEVLTAWLENEYEGGRHDARLLAASGSPLAVSDPVLAGYIEEERQRQLNNIELIASENFTSPAVMEAQGSCLTNKYAEGYPGRRWYGGCECVDKVEQLAIDRAKQLFGCDHANVQAHSGSQANNTVYQACIKPGDTILTMDLACGGHLSHGFFANFSGKLYNVVHYGVSPETECIDYDDMEKKALEVKPALILAGASAYSRTIDFERIRKICDEVGAVMFVDMAHIAGLVAAGVHPSPVPYADFVSTTTHKSLRGPRGGLVLCKEKWAKKLDSATFPGLQGGPLMHVIAAKAVCLREAMQPEFRTYAENVVKNAAALADALIKRGFSLVSGGTDNHLMLLDLRGTGITGRDLQEKLDHLHITVNKNAIPNDPQKPSLTSGVRIGTPAVTTRGMMPEDMDVLAECIQLCIENADANANKVRAAVAALTARYPIYR